LSEDQRLWSPTGPHVVVLAGPNGAGKSTAAPFLLHGMLGVTEFVNADVIARGLSAFAPESAAMEAGRITLKRLRQLADARADFAFETTLASRHFAPWLRELVAGGYDFHLIFLWLPSGEFAVERVRQRVLTGGHHVPDETVHRRYAGGLRNFVHLYRPIASTWQMLDSSLRGGPRLIDAPDKSAQGARKVTANRFSDSAAVEAASRRAVREALRRHKQLGQPVVIAENGKPVWLTPEQITFDDEATE
jgi:predicted ABC-type ATPase